MINPPYHNQLLREAANSLSRSIQSSEGAEVARLLRMLAFEPAAADGEHAAQEEPPRVGIWQQRVQDGEVFFVRRQEDINQWRDWANVGRIESKRSRFRVVLIGESVARGFFYEPRFTPALVLQHLLERELGRGTVEVLDLARTNLGFEVRELAIDALALEPDALVVFSGNNWDVGSGQIEDLEIECWTAALRASGVEGLRDCVAESARAAASSVVRDITAAYTSRNIPLYWIVPEFNLGDWHDQKKHAPYLRGRSNRDWVAAFENAQAALRAGDFAGAISYAEKLIQLDGGLSSAAPAIIGYCNLQLGNREAARHYLQLARDAEMWDWMAVTTPRPVRLVQDIIREQAAVPGVSVIDLPQLFAAHLHEGVPDRRMFLDYCHLTSEGIRVAMAGAAAAILGQARSRPVEWDSLLTLSPRPPAAAEADARLLAALHNAHWAQPPDTIRRLCSEALQASSAVAETMALVAHLQSTRVPPLLSRTGEQLLAVESQAAQHFIFHQSIQRYDKTLVDSIVDCLATVDPGCAGSIEVLRVRDHSAARRPANLLDFYYSSSACQLEEMGWAMPPPTFDKRFNRADFYRAYSNRSLFFFVGESGSPLRLGIVLRLHSLAAESGTVAVELNGIVAWSGSVTKAWTSVVVALPDRAIRSGTNELQLLWPEPELLAEQELAQVADQLARGVMCPLLPIYGEVHSATVMGAEG